MQNILIKIFVPEPLTCGDAPPPAPENGFMNWDDSKPVGVRKTRRFITEMNFLFNFTERYIC